MLTFIVHLCVVFLLQVACWLPATGTWEGEEHFQFIFGLAPRITIASILGFICGSTANAFTMDLMKRCLEGRNFKLRAFLSTCVGEPVDAFVFFSIAFTGLLPFAGSHGHGLRTGRREDSVRGLRIAGDALCGVPLTMYGTDGLAR